MFFWYTSNDARNLNIEPKFSYNDLMKMSMNLGVNIDPPTSLSIIVICGFSGLLCFNINEKHFD